MDKLKSHVREIYQHLRLKTPVLLKESGKHNDLKEGKSFKDFDLVSINNEDTKISIANGKIKVN
jgi:hypothetical protein